MDFLCEEDFHDKKKPLDWNAALQKLRGEYANDMIITAFVEVTHYEVIIVTVRKVRKIFAVTKGALLSAAWLAEQIFFSWYPWIHCIYRHQTYSQTYTCS